MRYVPNALTSLRLMGAVCLFILEPLAMPFYIVYSLCGISDVLDGFIARKYHVDSQYGALLDSIADLLFYSSMVWIVLDELIRDMAKPLWIWFFVIVSLRLMIYIGVGYRHHTFASMHTYANKACGFLLFLLPYMLHFENRGFYYFLGLLVAFYGTVEEIAIYWLKRGYDPDCKSIFFIKRDKDSTCAKTEI